MASIENISIDYFSYTIDAHRGVDERDFINILEDSASEHVLLLIEGSKAVPVRRHGYRAALHYDTGVTVLGGGQNHVLVEVQGRGCAELRDSDMLNALLEQKWYFCNRLDVAIDLSDEAITPWDVVGAGFSARITSKDVKETSSGTTITLGSRSSDRYTKIYKYNPPSDRTQTRIEYTLKGSIARAGANAYTHYSVEDLAKLCNNTVQLSYLEGKINSNLKEKIMSTRNRAPSEQRKINWLLRQVAPSVRTLLRDGAIDWEWVETHFKPTIYQSNFLEREQKND